MKRNEAALDADDEVRDGAALVEIIGLVALSMAEPKTLRFRMLHAPAQLTRGTKTPAALPEVVALGHPDRHRVHPDRRDPPPT